MNLSLKTSYSNSKMIEKKILNTLVKRFSTPEIMYLNDIFKIFDKDNDGIISKNEFTQGMKSVNPNINDEQVDELFKKIDYDDSEKISYSEFMAASIDKKNFDSEKKLLEIFDQLDKGNNGVIEYREFMKFIENDKENLFELQNDFKDLDWSLAFEWA